MNNGPRARPLPRAASRVRALSIIIPTSGRYYALKQCFESFGETRREAEIIIVDRHSQDGTDILAQDYGAVYIDCEARRSEARNIGAARATGDYLLFLDSDMRLSEGLLGECLRLSQEGSLDAVIVPEKGSGLSYWARCLALEKALLENQPGYEAARLVRKELFGQVGGYDTDLESGEDYDLHLRLLASGAIVGRTHRWIVHEVGRITLDELRDKFRLYQPGKRVFRQRYRLEVQKRKGIARLLMSRKELVVRYATLVPGYIFLKYLELIV